MNLISSLFLREGDYFSSLQQDLSSINRMSALTTCEIYPTNPGVKRGLYVRRYFMKSKRKKRDREERKENVERKDSEMPPSARRRLSALSVSDDVSGNEDVLVVADPNIL